MHYNRVADGVEGVHPLLLNCLDLFKQVYVFQTVVPRKLATFTRLSQLILRGKRFPWKGADIQKGPQTSLFFSREAAR